MHTPMPSHVNHTATPGSAGLLAPSVTLLLITRPSSFLPLSAANLRRLPCTFVSAPASVVLKAPLSRILARGKDGGQWSGYAEIVMSASQPPRLHPLHHRQRIRQ